MTHCRGCGGGAREEHSRDFRHLLGCGWRWRDGVEKREDRHTPSSDKKQRDYIRHAYEAGQAAANEDNTNMTEQIDAFINTLIFKLDKFNKD